MGLRLLFSLVLILPALAQAALLDRFRWCLGNELAFEPGPTAQVMAEFGFRQEPAPKGLLLFVHNHGWASVLLPADSPVRFNRRQSQRLFRTLEAGREVFIHPEALRRARQHFAQLVESGQAQTVAQLLLAPVLVRATEKEAGSVAYKGPGFIIRMPTAEVESREAPDSIASLSPEERLRLGEVLRNGGRYSHPALAESIGRSLAAAKNRILQAVRAGHEPEREDFELLDYEDDETAGTLRFRDPNGPATIIFPKDFHRTKFSSGEEELPFLAKALEQHRSYRHPDSNSAEERARLGLAQLFMQSSGGIASGELSQLGYKEVKSEPGVRVFENDETGGRLRFPKRKIGEVADSLTLEGDPLLEALVSGGSHDHRRVKEAGAEARGEFTYTQNDGAYVVFHEAKMLAAGWTLTRVDDYLKTRSYTVVTYTSQTTKKQIRLLLWYGKSLADIGYKQRRALEDAIDYGDSYLQPGLSPESDPGAP